MGLRNRWQHDTLTKPREGRRHSWIPTGLKCLNIHVHNYGNDKLCRMWDIGEGPVKNGKLYLWINNIRN